MTVCVVALGKIGLPLAVQIASKNENVIGADINPAVVKLVANGEEPFSGEAKLAEKLYKVTNNGTLKATTNTTEAVSKSDYVIVVVPVIVDNQGNPDFAAIDAATNDIAKGLKDGCLVSYETTLPIGTTRERFLPALELESGLKCGSDFFLCHSPERVFSGRIFADLRKYPKLIGGIDIESSRRAVKFYEKILDFDHRDDLEKPNGVWDLGSSEAAEMAKLVETTYRNVNIALANEFALHAEDLGIDIGPIIEASNSQPYSHVHNPGIAVGGHCIPVYPKFYLSTDSTATLPSSSIAVNESMPKRAVHSLYGSDDGALSGKIIAVLGAAYRNGVKETAFSGVFSLVKEIENLGGTAVVHDPLYTDVELSGLGLTSFQLGNHCDAAIVQTDHEIYTKLSSSDLPGAEILYDGRRIVDKSKLSPIKVIVIGIG
jgi:nucleotide sugar dehydrogenase